MTDFVDRLEQELLAAGRRARARRRVRAAAALAVTALLSLGVVGAVGAAILSSGHGPRPTPTAALPQHCWQPPRDPASAVAPSTDASPSTALLSLLGVLRRPATNGDRISLRGLIYTPITAVYSRYVRVVDTDGMRVALVLAQVCGRVRGSPYPARPPASPPRSGVRPYDAIFLIALDAPRPRAMFEAATAAQVEAGGAIRQAWPEGGRSLVAVVVPDGVARVELSFGTHQPRLSMPVRDNLALATPSPGPSAVAVTWYDSSGRTIHHEQLPVPGVPCTAQELDLSSPRFISPMAGEHADWFAVTNISARNCTVEGYPTVYLYAGTRLLPVSIARGSGPYVTHARPRPVALAPGSSAYFIVAKYRCDVQTVAAASSFAILIPGIPGEWRRDAVGPSDSQVLQYCQGPGNVVAVSPLGPSLRAARPLG
jgi:hypothetical protein